MAYVITQRCVNDTSCIAECPVDCIRPTPDQREFANAEMLYIDPDVCINCGACADACPVDAIHSEDELVTSLARFREVNSAFFQQHPLRPRPAADQRAAAAIRVVEHPPLRVVIVGSGPSASYAAEALLASGRTEIDMLEQLPTPGGLIRAGVAPDHQETKRIADLFENNLDTDAFRYHLNVEVGRHVSHDELLQHYHAVIYATGASSDRRLAIPGEDLPGSYPATHFVGWYNGHPDHADHTFDLSCERAVIVGNGNVALDIARILTVDPNELARTDIADHALKALRDSAVREVILLGRRGVAEAAYTTPEFMALRHLHGVDVLVDHRDLAYKRAAHAASEDPQAEHWLRLKIQLAEEYARRPPTSGNKRITLRYLTSPVEVIGSDHATALRVVRNELIDTNGIPTAHPTNEFDSIPTRLILRSIGYRGRPIPDLPFDVTRGIVPNDRGRVLQPERSHPRTYVTGWIKRGPQGVIGTNKICARETAATLLSDFLAGALAEPPRNRDDFADLLSQRQPDLIDREGWRFIDAAERDSGIPARRPRVKFTAIQDMVAAAKSGLSERRRI
ncbi:ferredoxin--NADP+ reductase [Nocardia amikacinitolerans]|uniref:4Fe-4S binding protein n=1 Tax=Nocardia amikacinitolerans TaxID=756689 RepID=UPI000834AB82|nr:4Fe-4S binding protein [Nocardia amikacinitolerans]MCP2320212.1 ferredoxin--NADP+ reductase [Nocardia amikacinitolerans]